MSDLHGQPAEPPSASATDPLPDPALHAAGLHASVVHDIRWSDALPWWLLFRAAGSSFAPTVFLLAALGCLATWAGWSIADRIGLADAPARPAAGAAASGDELVLPAPAGAAPANAPGLATVAGARALPLVAWLRDLLPTPVGHTLRLVKLLFEPAATLREAGGAIARLAWLVLVWSIFGTGIARHVALKLVGEDAPGPLGALWYGASKWLAAFNAAAFVLVGIASLSLPGAALGLAMRTEWGLAIAGAIWPLVLAGAVVLAILAVGVVAGWPLMVAAVGVERGDSFQAISTAFSYVYQRPLHYAFYALVAAAVALPTLAVAAAFADATGNLALWAASFGMGHDRTAEVLAWATGDAAGAPFGGRAIAFWTRCLEGLLSSFGWGYAWAIATAAYMLLRRDVDGTEFDEVVIEEPAGAE
jgi:hypothetical protein